MTDLPSLYGFRIATGAPLRFLRMGGGREPLEIVVASSPDGGPSGEPLAEWDLQGTAYPARATLHRTVHGYEFRTTDAGCFRIDLAHGRIEIPAGGDEFLREQRLSGIPMILAYRHRGDVSLHAAAVEIDGGAVILAAPSRFGKTTLALAFHRRGYRVLSEDLVCCRPSTGEVLPGPAVVRLRPDVFSGEAPPGTHVAVARPDRVFVAIDAAGRGSGAPVPLRGLCFLNEADQLRVEPMTAAGALPALWQLHFHLPTTDERAEAFRRLTAIAAAAASWTLHRPMRLEALDATVDLVVEAVATGRA
jgi:hypothetical protein